MHVFNVDRGFATAQLAFLTQIFFWTPVSGKVS